MGTEFENIDVHFNKCSADYDRHFYEDLGMCEFYDEIEKQINNCGDPKNILVLGCGTGLEIERIKHDSTVTAIDISSGMLEKLKKKDISSKVELKTICGSYFDVSLGENDFDMVLSTYSFHHFTEKQKTLLYKKIYKALKLTGCFINGDTVSKDKDAESDLLKRAHDYYNEKQQAFGTLHIDVPLALDTEYALISGAGFRDISLERRWTKTALIKSIK